MLPREKVESATPNRKKILRDDCELLQYQMYATYTTYMNRKDDSLNLYKASQKAFNQTLEVLNRQRVELYINRADNKNKAIWDIISSKVKTRNQHIPTDSLNTDKLNSYFVEVEKNF
ncbi:hypothetical protein HHI36_012421 [Cryptolaemus montrouzieri]|uniref:Uncharacterized protein n=1 Tax=Cryptolaemus montrouzieri TaxID=559131 RepID=A0ABD2NEV9_9CUCU